MTQWGLDTLFNPAKRHMDEEKRRLQSTREEVGDNSGGRRIDLESGKVVIRRADEDDEVGEQSEPAETAQAETAASAQDQPAQAGDGKAARARNGKSARAEQGRPAKANGKPAKAEDATAKDKPAPSAAAQRAAARRGRTAR